MKCCLMDMVLRNSSKLLYIFIPCHYSSFLPFFFFFFSQDEEVLKVTKLVPAGSESLSSPPSLLGFRNGCLPPICSTVSLETPVVRPQVSYINSYINCYSHEFAKALSAGLIVINTSFQLSCLLQM